MHALFVAIRSIATNVRVICRDTLNPDKNIAFCRDNSLITIDVESYNSSGSAIIIL